mgnify:CR=1 FL=1
MLPEAKKLPEADYDALCRTLIHRLEKAASDSAAARQDMTDYYTMWMHQIKTPIFAMHLLLSDGTSDKDKEISSELFKIEQYVSMALNYLRLDSDKNDLVLKPAIYTQVCPTFYPQKACHHLHADQCFRTYR